MNRTKLTSVLLCGIQLLLADIATAQTTPVQVQLDDQSLTSSPLPNLPPPPFVRPNPTGMLIRTLSLTDAQKQQVQPYIDAIQPQFDAVLQQARQAEDTLFQQLAAQIRPFLTAEQQAKVGALQTLHRGDP